MISAKIKKLQAAANEKERLAIYKEIKTEAENINFPSEEVKKSMLDMFYSTIEMYISECKSDVKTHHNCKMLDTFYILEKMHL